MRNRNTEAKSSNSPIEMEELGAFLDGELSPDRAAEVAELISRHRDLSDLLEDYEAQTVELRNLDAASMSEPVPEHLTAIIRGARKNDRET